MTFKNTNFIKRDYECTNIVACVAEKAPAAYYAPCSDEVLNGLTRLWTQASVTFYGYL